MVGPDFFRQRYGRARSGATLDAERAIVGEVVGLNGYTTIDQAQRLADALDLRPDELLLDLGAGRGWPGIFLADVSGCRVVLSDIPVEGLRESRALAAARGVSERVSAVCADGRSLPFLRGSFDAISHADVFC